MKFKVELTTTSIMRGFLTVEADNEDDAADLALKKTGDVEWNYEGSDDEDTEVQSVKPVK